MVYSSPKSRKGWLMTYLITLPPMPALLMTPLIQTAEHTMAALMVVFMIFKHSFNKQHDIKSRSKRRKRQHYIKYRPKCRK